MNLNWKTLSLSAVAGLALVLGACERHPAAELGLTVDQDKVVTHAGKPAEHGAVHGTHATEHKAEVPAPKHEAAAAPATPEPQKKFFPESN